MLPFILLLALVSLWHDVSARDTRQLWRDLGDVDIFLAPGNESGSILKHCSQSSRELLEPIVEGQLLRVGVKHGLGPDVDVKLRLCPLDTFDFDCTSKSLEPVGLRQHSVPRFANSTDDGHGLTIFTFRVPEGQAFNLCNLQVSVRSGNNSVITQCSEVPVVKATNSPLSSPRPLQRARREDQEHETLTEAEIWGYSFASVAVISCTSLLAILFIPLLRKGSDNLSRGLFVFLISLGVSVMFSDAIVHLIPHALFPHGHEDHGDHGDEEHEECVDIGSEYTILWKCVVLVASAYALLLLETMLHMLGVGHSHGAVATDCDSDIEATSHHDSKGEDHEHSAHKMFDYKAPSKPLREVSTVAWVVVIGGTCHNLVDGIAIGASFATDVSLGLSTAITVLIHEIPHELSDIAVLMHSGLSFKAAILLNMLTACIGLLGVVLGVLVSTEEVTPWILMATAGQFLYISLCDMFPQLLGKNLQLIGRPILTFVLSQSGLLLGFGFMLLIAFFE